MGFGASIVALALVVTVTLIAFQIARTETAKVHDNHIPSVEAAASLLVQLERMDNLEFLYLSAGQDRQERLRDFDAAAAELQEALERAEAMVVTPAEVEIYSALGRHYGAFLHIHQRMRGLAAQGRWAEARALNATESLRAEIAFRQAGLRFVQLNLDAADRAQLAEERSLLVTEVLAVSIALVGALIAGYLWRRASRDLVEPLDHLRRAAGEVLAGHAIGDGHPAAAKTEELAILQAEVHRMAANLQAAATALQATNADLEAKVAERTAATVAANERLASLVEELRTLDRLKSDFVATTSHELLTPLAFIVGFASTLEDGLLGPLNERQADAVAKILEGAERLTRMVRNTLEYGQAEAGHLQVHLEAVDVGPLVREVAEALRAKADDAGEAVHVSVEDALPAAWADPDRVGQVVEELLTNAIAFTPRGGRIEVRVSGGGDAVVCEVADTGPGIPPDAIDRLYQPFYQVDSSRTRRHGGLGLGLPLANHIVRRMGGEMGVRSRVGQGTTVRFTLPTAGAGRERARAGNVAIVSLMPPSGPG